MFLLYDTETTGLSTSFDQVVEFAAIACDKEFNIINKYMYDIRLTRDSIPAIEAMQVTGKIPSLYNGISERDALSFIYKILSSYTWNGGYNTLRFDDELLRFSFYRHGLNPYNHQKRSLRFDLLPIVTLFYIIHKEKLAWPIRDDASVSLKLENLNQCNNWKVGSAHQAMFDVEVCLELMRNLSSIDSKLLNFALDYFKRDVDIKRTQDYLFRDKKAWAYLLDSRFSGKTQFIMPCFYLGPHPLYQNQTIWQSMLEPNRIIYKKYGEAPWVMPANIVNYLHEEIVYCDSMFSGDFVYENPVPIHAHPEADLYISKNWYDKVNGITSSPYYLWRYYDDYKSCEIIDDHREYLLTGYPLIKTDHKSVRRRSLLDINLDGQTQEIINFYENVKANISK